MKTRKSIKMTWDVNSFEANKKELSKLKLEWEANHGNLAFKEDRKII
jgi:hypothetical protein